MAEETPEQRKRREEAEGKALESRLILQEQLKLLGQTETERLAKVRAERELDEARGRARGQELFGEGALGRVGEDPTAKALELQRQREGSLAETRGASAEDVAAREGVTAQTVSALDELIQQRVDPSSELAKLQRSKGREEINRALQTQLGQIRAQGNIAQSGVTQALVGDALGGAIQARAGLERDIMLGGLQAAEDLTLQREAARELGQTKREDLRARGRAEEQALRDRLENIQAQIQDDTLRRQLINLDQRSKELFGRLSTEQNIVAQGVAERSGVRQQIIAEVGQAESTRAQRESERIQEIEARKEAPSGGKIICGELHRQGLLDDDVYAGDLAYAQKYISRDVAEGYWLWAKWVVRGMRKSASFTAVVKPFASAWATEMAHRVGYVEKGSFLGKVLSVVGEPLCDLLGKAKKLLEFGSSEIYSKMKDFRL